MDSCLTASTLGNRWVDEGQDSGGAQLVKFAWYGGRAIGLAGYILGR